MFLGTLKIDKSVTIYIESLQYLLVEIYKVKKGISPTIMKFFNFSKIRSMNLGAKLWNMIPVNIKSSESLNVFKSKIKYWIPNYCPCQICKTDIGQVAFVN